MLPIEFRSAFKISEGQIDMNGQTWIYSLVSKDRLANTVSPQLIFPDGPLLRVETILRLP